ncbi:hypothetical protein RRG08_040468 [Elysia crispata]|uniref:Uncharacterized protein n=1 Tax=Elysia crispata TaxID=231223 RepID=A0AAE1DDR5_9GAST|nr:hypothetical protein RRG08_040468 [Elysia crispata]
MRAVAYRVKRSFRGRSMCHEVYQAGLFSSQSRPPGLSQYRSRVIIIISRASVVVVGWSLAGGGALGPSS